MSNRINETPSISNKIRKMEHHQSLIKDQKNRKTREIENGVKDS